MVKVIIVEDETLSARRIVRLLDELRNDIKVLEIFATVEATVNYLKHTQHSLDLIFLDIHLADGSGFQVFDQVTIQIPVIFTTAYDKYALRAFEQTSVDYLMKPIQKSELDRGLRRFDQFFRHPVQDSVDYSQILKLFQPTKKTLKKRFLVQAGTKINSVAVQEIHLFYAESKACYLITNEGKRYFINYTLENLINLLDEDLFFKLSRKVIVNVNAISEVFQYSKSRYKVEVTYPPNFDIFISADKVGDFKRWLNR